MAYHRPLGFTWNHERANELREDVKGFFVVSGIVALLLSIAVCISVFVILTRSAVAQEIDQRYPQLAQHSAPAQFQQHRRVSHRSRRGHKTRYAALDANGNAASLGIVRSQKTGATARVSARYAAEFQAYVNDLEANGATIRFMGGIRRGHCGSGSQHPCGKALDVCQLSRDRVDSRCNLPSRSTMISIASNHGLFEGGAWCHGDRGHAQADLSAGACGTTQYASARSHRLHHRRYASR